MLHTVYVFLLIFLALLDSLMMLQVCANQIEGWHTVVYSDTRRGKIQLNTAVYSFVWKTYIFKRGVVDDARLFFWGGLGGSCFFVGEMFGDFLKDFL